MFKKIALASLLALMSTSAHATQLLVNGGFEQSPVDNYCCSTVTAGNSFNGWDVLSGDINIVTGTFETTPVGRNGAYRGTQYLDLVGQSGGGSISQTFATMPGQSYELSFAFAHNLFGGTPSASASFAVGDLSGTLFHNSGTTSDLDWKTYLGQFIAGPGATSTLIFVNLTGYYDAGILLDAVSITAVPETGTWLMMIGGIGMIGGVIRRRPRPAVATA